VAHVLIQRWVKAEVERIGLSAEIECFRDGKAVDVGVPKKDTAIEVALSTIETEPAQAERDLESWERVVVLCPNKAVFTKVTRAFKQSATDMSRVTVCRPKDLGKVLTG
jgi:hypothetical protein